MINMIDEESAVWFAVHAVFGLSRNVARVRLRVLVSLWARVLLLMKQIASFRLAAERPALLCISWSVIQSAWN